MTTGPTLGAITDGDRFAGHSIVRCIGRGGMGEVFLAEHPRLPRMVALKVLNAGLSDSIEDRLRFAREARLAARLRHPAIVQIYDHGEHAHRLWTSMEFIDGDDTLSLLRAGGPLTPEWVSAIVTTAAGGLDFAHSQQIAHRDVKPANILVRSTDGELPEVYLADFGIARKIVGGTRLTRADTIVGSIEYAAPERLTDRPVSGAADQYSLACTAYHLLTGRLPFDEKNLTDLVQSHLFKAPPKAQKTLPSLHWMVDEVLARSMSKEPADRYRSCTEFTADLSEALALGPASPRPKPATIGAPDPVLLRLSADSGQRVTATAPGQSVPAQEGTPDAATPPTTPPPTTPPPIAPPPIAPPSLPDPPELPDLPSLPSSRARGTPASRELLRSGIASQTLVLPGDTRNLKRERLMSTIAGDSLPELSESEPETPAPMPRMWLASVALTALTLIALIVTMAVL